MNTTAHDARGFSLLELIFVSAVIAILALIVYASLGNSRAKAHDAARVSDISQIQLALRLYKNTHDTYPDCADGWVLGSGAAGADCTDAIDTILTPYIARIPTDPRDGREGFGYVYDSEYTCDGETVSVVYAETAEFEINQTWSTTCVDTEDSEAYGVILR